MSEIMTSNLDQAYKLLSLKPASTKEEIKKRSKELERIWNPARFASQEEKDQAKQKLQEKKEAINRLLNNLDRPGQVATDALPEQRSAPIRGTKRAILLVLPLLILVLAVFILSKNQPAAIPNRSNSIVSTPKDTNPIVSLPEDRKLTVAIQPLGEISDDYVNIAKSAIEQTFDVLIIVRNTKQLSPDAYYSENNRFKADKLLPYLQSLDNTADKVIGLTNVDISTRKGSYADWGILGLADDHACIVSTFRMRPETVSPEIFEKRLRNVTLSRFAYTLGLKTCENVGCVLGDSRGTVLTVDSEDGFCEDCKNKIANVLHSH